MFSFKIDLDFKMTKSLERVWLKTRKAILKELGFKLKEVNSQKTRRGSHWWFIVYGKKVEAKKANAIQLMLGSDVSKAIIDARRIKRGIPWKEANKLFSKTLWRKKHKCNCSIHQKILKRMKEGQKEFEKLEW